MPTTEDRRAALEAIAFGDDPHVRPADRLKALEMLGEEEEECWACQRRAEKDPAEERALREDPDRGRRVAEGLIELGGLRLLAQTMLGQLEGTAGAEPACEILAEAARRSAKELIELKRVEAEVESAGSEVHGAPFRRREP